jgi:hypothetical protein
MMNKLIFAITTLAVLMHLNPAFAKASEPSLDIDAHPISGLIGDWDQFRTSILDKTKRYDKYNDIAASQFATLPNRLVGQWRAVSSPSKPGNQLQTELTLNANHKFKYQYAALTGNLRQEWDFSGRWEVKNQILMLLIDQSSYPGEQRHDILFWRVLHIGDSKLVYVRSGADEMVALRKGTLKSGS